MPSESVHIADLSVPGKKKLWSSVLLLLLAPPPAFSLLSHPAPACPSHARLPGEAAQDGVIASSPANLRAEAQNYRLKFLQLQALRGSNGPCGEPETNHLKWQEWLFTQYLLLPQPCGADLGHLAALRHDPEPLHRASFVSQNTLPQTFALCPA